MFSTGLRKLIVFVASWGLVFIAFYFFLWNPSVSSLKKTRKEISFKRKVLAQIKKDVETWPKTVTAEKLKKAEEDLQKLFAKIPPEEDIPGILKHIQYSAATAHLNVMEIASLTREKTKQEPYREGKEPTGQSYAKVTYKLTANGDFLDVIRFLRGLEKAERLIIIEDLDLERESGEKGSVRAEVTVNLFYTKAELAADKAALSR